MQKTIDIWSALGTISTNIGRMTACGMVKAFVDALKLGADHDLLTLDPLHGSLIGVGCALEAVHLGRLKDVVIWLLRDGMMVCSGPIIVAIFNQTHNKR